MENKLKIVADENMPGVDGLFGDFAEVVFAPGRAISSSMVKNADAILCRSITSVNQSLLDGSTVKFVGTATIGIDHLDTKFLEEHQISWSNAAGCNAAAVAQYVLSASALWCLENNKSLKQQTIGIVGAGNVGTELSRCLDKLSIDYRLYDPPLKNIGDPRRFATLDQILNCDVISIHVPLTSSGDYATRHMIDTPFLNQLNQNQLLINASRGAVANNVTLNDYLAGPNAATVVLDVFENEPNLSMALARRCLLSTTHIAGHTLEGKLRGTWMVYKAFCEVFNFECAKSERDFYPKANSIDIDGLSLEAQLLAIYNPQSNSQALTGHSGAKDETLAQHFDALRKNATIMPDGSLRRDYEFWDYQGKQRLFL